MAYTSRKNSAAKQFGTSIARLVLAFLRSYAFLIGLLYTASAYSQTPFELTLAEQQWLDAHPVVRYTGDPEWLPYEAFDSEGNHIGIVSDLLGFIEKITGITFERVPSDTWAEAIEMAKDKRVDLIAEGINSQNLVGTHTFTQAFVSGPIVIFSANPSINHIADVSTILDKKIGFVDLYSYTWKLRETYPNTDFVSVDTVAQGVAMAASGDLDYFVSHYGAGRFYSLLAGVDHFHVAGQLNVDLELAFAVRSDWPELTAIINKAMLSAPIERRRNLSERWFINNSHYVQNARRGEFIQKTLVVGVSLAGFISIVIWLWARDVKRHHARYQTALAQVSAGEFEYNPSTKKLFVSRVFMHRLGITDVPSNLAEFLAIVAHEDQGLVASALALARHDDSKPDIEFHLLPGFGGYLLRLRGQWRLASGLAHKSQLVGTLEDVTQLRASQVEAEQQKLFLRSVIDAIPDAIFIRDWSTNSYTLVNKALADFLGSTVERITGIRDEQLLARNSLHQNTIDRDHKVLRTQEILRSEIAWPSQIPGQEIVFDSIKVPLIKKENGIDGVLTIARDATETRELVDKLEQFSLFAQRSPIGLGMTSPQRLFTYANGSLVQLLLGAEGREEDLIGRDFVDFYTESSTQALHREVFPYLFEHDYWEGELDLSVVSGRVVPTRQAFHLVRGDDGEIRFICGMAVDVSDERKIREELAESRQKAEQANQAKSIFLANMSHEIRTPLNAIIGFSQLLSRDGTLSSEPLAQVRKIETAGRRLLSLINDVLDLSKIEAGKLALNEDSFDIHQELEDVYELLKVRAEEKGLETQCNIELGADRVVLGDRLKISQVVLNIFSNAVKFTDQGSVALSACWDNNNNLLIKVIDTGEGVDEGETDSIFQTFAQGKMGEQAGGTGLGLPLSRRMVELMGGTLTLRNRDDLPNGASQGVVVEICLPLQKRTNASSYYSDRLAGARLKSTEEIEAAVIDDDDSSRELITGYLQSIGVSVVVEAEDGQAGLTQLEQRVPQIVFTDIRMPKVPGLTLLKKLRANKAYDNVKIIAVTASSLEHQRDHFLAEGFDDFIGKPVDLDQVNRVLDAHVDVQWELVEVEMQPEAEAIQQASAPVLAPAQRAVVIGAADKVIAALAMGDVDQVSQLLESWQDFAGIQPAVATIKHWLSRYNLEKAEAVVEALVADLKAQAEGDR